MVNSVVNDMVIHRVKGMAKAAHKPPARIRYEESHPTVSCRLSRDLYNLLKQRLDDLGGISFADFVKDSLGLQQARIPDIRKINETAHKRGYDQALKKHQIWYYCAVCRERINMEPNSDSHKAMIGYMSEHRWRHKSCHGQ